MLQKRLNLLHLGLILILLSSCNGVKKGDKMYGEEPIQINLNSSTAHYSIASFVDSLSVVALESNKNSIISGPWAIQKVIFRNGKYFILDDTYAAIKVFDSTGKYLYDIGKIGLGPGEFVKVEDIVYSPLRESLFVLCNNPTKIEEFTLGGKLIKSQKLFFFAHSLGLLKNDLRLFYVNQNKSRQSEIYNLIVTDSFNQVKERFFEMPKNFESVIKFSGGLFTAGDETYFNPAVSPTYYLVSGKSATAAFNVKYDNQVNTEDIVQKDLFQNLRKYTFQYSRFVKTNHYIGFNYLKEDIGSAFYNIQSNKVLLGDIKLDSLNIIFNSSMFQSGEKIIMILDTKKQSKFLNDNRSSILKRFPEFKKILDLKDQNFNPTLVIFKLKV